MNKTTGIGLMSGTSLDGVDIALCEFWKDSKYHFNIKQAATIPYNNSWTKKLSNANSLSASEFIYLDNEYGSYLGELVNEFKNKHKIKPYFIASHGHTIFHQPDKNITYQLGNGAYIAAKTELTTISDFRTLDIAMLGQGAPLVPIGDKLLFGEYDACINLGGFANISYDENNQRIAYDICPVNIVLNLIAEQLGYKFDKNGELGKNGKIIPELLEKLNQLAFYEKQPPKSLGLEWVTSNIIPLLNAYSDEKDVLSTIYEHISIIISNVINNQELNKVLITGGGAFNTFLMEAINNKCLSEIIIPDDEIINYKEALIFCFLGYLRLNHLPNTLSSVTGAKTNLSSGVIHLINKKSSH